MFVFKRVKEVIVGVLGVDESEILPDAFLKKDLGANDYDYAAILQIFEAEFNIRISNEDAQGLNTVREAVKYIESKVNNKD